MLQLLKTAGFQAAITVVAVAGIAVAQENVSPLPGARLRLTAPSFSKEPVVGRLVAIDQREVVLSIEGSADPVRVPLTELARVERSNGTRGHAVKGLFVGALAGAALLGILAASDPAEESDSSDAVYYLAAAGLGALPGAGIGALIRTDRWSEVPTSHLRVTVAPTQGRGLRVRLAWSR